MKAISSDSSFSSIEMKILQLIVLFFVFISGPLSVKAQQTTEYISPDGSLKAVFILHDKKDDGYENIKFEIKKINGKIIASSQYGSPWGGTVKVAKVAWTTDSQYFVISISDSDNLKIFPAYFFDRPFKRFRILPVRATNPQFEIIKRDIIRIQSLQENKSQKGTYEDKFTDIELNNLPKPVYELTDEQSYKNYTVKTFFNKEDDKGYYEIIRNGKTVFKQEGFKFRIGLVYTDDEFIEMGSRISNNLITMGKDITGKGEPNLVVNEWSGGAHCCYTFDVFEIGKKFREITTLDAVDGDYAHFEDIRRNGKLVFVASDWTFAYWNTCFANSPAPSILLEFKDNEYVLAKDLMRKRSPAQKVIDDKIKIIQKDDSWKDGKPPVELWKYMLDLIYSGNAKVAWHFFDKAWLHDFAGKKEFMQSFKTQLEKSPYWTQIKEMNN